MQQPNLSNDPQHLRLVSLLNEELLRREPVPLGVRYDGTTCYVRFRAALAALWVQVHIQSDAAGEGGLTAYDPNNYTSTALVDCRANRIQTSTFTPSPANRYAVFLVPVQYDGAGAKILYDGQGGRPDNMSFVEVSTAMNNYYDRVKSSWLTVHKFGENDTITTATDPEDVWDIGGVFTVANQFPAAAAVTTIVCANAADDFSTPGTGARTVTVVGIDNSGAEISQTVETDGAGTTITTLGTNLKRIHRMYVASAGSGETNAGTITGTIGGNNVAQILAGQGQTQMAVYTVPTGYSKYYLTNFSVGITGVVTSAEAEFYLVLRRNGVVRFLDHRVANKPGMPDVQIPFDNWIELLAGDDVWVRCQEVSATCGVNATFDIVGIP